MLALTIAIFVYFVAIGQVDAYTCPDGRVVYLSKMCHDDGKEALLSRGGDDYDDDGEDDNDNDDDDDGQRDDEDDNEEDQCLRFKAPIYDNSPVLKQDYTDVEVTVDDDAGSLTVTFRYPWHEGGAVVFCPLKTDILHSESGYPECVEKHSTCSTIYKGSEWLDDEKVFGDVSLPLFPDNPLYTSTITSGGQESFGCDVVETQLRLSNEDLLHGDFERYSNGDETVVRVDLSRCVVYGSSVRKWLYASSCSFKWTFYVTFRFNDSLVIENIGTYSVDTYTDHNGMGNVHAHVSLPIQYHAADSWIDYHSVSDPLEFEMIGYEIYESEVDIYTKSTKKVGRYQTDGLFGGHVLISETGETNRFPITYTLSATEGEATFDLPITLFIGDDLGTIDSHGKTIIMRDDSFYVLLYAGKASQSDWTWYDLEYPEIWERSIQTGEQKKLDGTVDDFSWQNLTDNSVLVSKIEKSIDVEKYCFQLYRLYTGKEFPLDFENQILFKSQNRLVPLVKGGRRDGEESGSMLTLGANRSLMVGDGMSWWGVMLIVLGSVAGCVGVVVVFIACLLLVTTFGCSLGGCMLGLEKLVKGVERMSYSPIDNNERELINRV